MQAPAGWCRFLLVPSTVLRLLLASTGSTTSTEYEYRCHVSETGTSTVIPVLVPALPNWTLTGAVVQVLVVKVLAS
jgi:hypothetical protein